MIGSISQGRNFGGLFRYLLDLKKQAIMIGGNVASRSIGGLTREFQAVADLNPQVAVAVKHIALGFAPEDGEVARSLKEEIAMKLLAELGYENSQYIIVEHPRSDHNHDHDHIHIVVNTVGLDGVRVKNGFEWRRTEKILREIEREYDLTPVACSWESARSLPTKGQAERYRRELTAAAKDPSLPQPELPVSTRLQQEIERIIPQSPTMTEFVARLQAMGVEVKPKITRTGLVQGLSYSLDGVAFQGAHLQGCSFPKLQARGVSYERERDLPHLKAVARGEQLILKVEEPITPEVDLLTEYQPHHPQTGSIDRVEPTIEMKNESITSPEIEKFAVVNADVSATEADGSDEIDSRSNVGQQGLDNPLPKVEKIELNTSIPRGVDPLLAAPQIFKFLQFKNQNHFTGSRYDISWEKPILKVTDKSDRILLEAEGHRNERGQVVWMPKPIPIDSPGIPAEMFDLVVEYNHQQERTSRPRLRR